MLFALRPSAYSSRPTLCDLLPVTDVTQMVLLFLGPTRVSDS